MSGHTYKRVWDGVCLTQVSRGGGFSFYQVSDFCLSGSLTPSQRRRHHRWFMFVLLCAVTRVSRSKPHNNFFFLLMRLGGSSCLYIHSSEVMLGSTSAKTIIIAYLRRVGGSRVGRDDVLSDHGGQPVSVLETCTSCLVLEYPEWFRQVTIDAFDNTYVYTLGAHEV